jgi:hypothetical protein
MTSITSQIRLELRFVIELSRLYKWLNDDIPTTGTSPYVGCWHQQTSSRFLRPSGPLDPPIAMTSGVQGWTSVLMWTDVSKVLVLQRVRHGMAPQHYLGTNLLAFLCIEFSSLEF